MFTAERKLKLLKKIIETSDEQTLAELEAVLKKSKEKHTSGNKPLSIYDFLGILTKKEGEEMRLAIRDSCG